MWYVVQTQSGEEQRIMELFKKLADRRRYSRCFIPLFEDVRKREGKARIVLRRFFPSYFFIETDDPVYVSSVIKGIPDFARMLGVKEDGGFVFIPVGQEDEEFLKTLLEEGLMRVSFVDKNAKGHIKRFVGPLEKYSNRITYLDVMRRRAIVEVDLFGKRRRFKFGLWTKDDYPIGWIEKRRKEGGQTAPITEGFEIGLHPGDYVRDVTGLYGEDVLFKVEAVNPLQRTIKVNVNIFGTSVSTEMSADQVERAE